MQNGLKMHIIASMVMTKYKEKATNAKLERSFEKLTRLIQYGSYPKPKY